MKSAAQPVLLKSCPKQYTRDLDKAIPPEETIKKVTEKLASSDLSIVSNISRIDNGRLGIPVYLASCGSDARAIMPTRKQMGKGSSPAQAQASALMELMERYAFFSFFDEESNFITATWSEAKELFGEELIPVSEILKSVDEELGKNQAEELLNLVSWRFYPATCLNNGRITWLPLDWFRLLGEFNGSSAGNTAEESILQGLSELIERHACCIVDRQKPVLPTIDPASCHDPVLLELLDAFRREKINLILKDFSLGMPMPTVAALAWDPATFPEKSEIVFTAGTASSPARAAIRAITEVAQLGGDFCSSSCYEASGLPKFTDFGQFAWLQNGPLVSLYSLPDVNNEDMHAEIKTCLQKLLPIHVYAVSTTNPLLNVPAHYCIAPGLQFRERDANACLGLFIGRKLAEEYDLPAALAGLHIISKIYPKTHFPPFFHGLANLRAGNLQEAFANFKSAIPLQPEGESRAMAEFYAGYALTLNGQWREALPWLEKAASDCPQMKEYVNLLGVAYYKLDNYVRAEEIFDQALRLDKGSAMDLANRGICRLLQHKKELARQDLEAALHLDPSLDFARARLEQLEQ